MAHHVGLLSISTLAARRGEGEGCWDLPGSGASSCRQPTAPEVAAKKPIEELERHHVERDTLCSGVQGERAAGTQLALTEVGGKASWGAERNGHSMIPSRKL